MNNSLESISHMESEKPWGAEEYKRVLKRQNAFLASVQIIGVQDPNEEILEQISTYWKAKEWKLKKVAEKFCSPRRQYWVWKRPT